MAEIPLSQGYSALVSPEDLERVAQHRWYAGRSGNPKYIYARTKISDGTKWSRSVLLHRFIVGAASSQIVDHRNGNTLDCTRENLRIANKSQNASNCHTPPRSVSGFRGVYPHKTKWAAMIKINNRQIYLGAFADKALAIAAREEAERKYFGEFAPPSTCC